MADSKEISVFEIREGEKIQPNPLSWLVLPRLLTGERLSRSSSVALVVASLVGLGITIPMPISVSTLLGLKEDIPISPSCRVRALFSLVDDLLVRGEFVHGMESTSRRAKSFSEFCY